MTDEQADQAAVLAATEETLADPQSVRAPIPAAAARAGLPMNRAQGAAFRLLNQRRITVEEGWGGSVQAITRIRPL